LVEALPARDELILVGPSAGHCLPLEHLRCFSLLTVLEPDPVARFLLQRGLGRRNMNVEARDLLVAPLVVGGSGLADLLDARPRASVLFCNVLGQLQFGLSDAQHELFREQFQQQLLPRLRARAWASFHDRWSLDRDATESAVPSPLVFPRAPSDEELGVACFGRAGPAVTVLDHGTARLFPEAAPHRYFAWQITPQALHVVEAVSA